MDLVKLFYVFCNLPNKSKLKFDQAFNASLKMLNESMYSMPWVRCAVGNVWYSMCSCFSLDCCICPWLSVKLYKKISFPDGWARNIFPKYWFSDIIGNIEHSCKKRWNLLLLAKFLQPDNWTTQSRKGWSFEQNWHCMCSSSCNSLMGSHSIYPPNLLRSP